MEDDNFLLYKVALEHVSLLNWQSVMWQASPVITAPW